MEYFCLINLNLEAAEAETKDYLPPAIPVAYFDQDFFRYITSDVTSWRQRDCLQLLGLSMSITVQVAYMHVLDECSKALD